MGLIMKKNEKRLQGMIMVSEMYENASLAWHTNCRFAQDMIQRLQHGKALSKKQRDWVDNLIDQPLPEGKNPDLYKKLTKYSTVPGLSEWHNNTMKEMSRSAFLWNLSEKQVNFANRLIDDAIRLEHSGPYIPDGEILKKLQLVVQMSKTRNMWWWENNPGTHRALERIKTYLQHHKEGTFVSIQERDVNKVLKSFKTRLEDFLNPKWRVGDSAWVKIHPPGISEPIGSPVSSRWEFTTIISGPILSEVGEQLHECIVGGAYKRVPLKNIKKQRR
jgi:hypothetical protein